MCLFWLFHFQTTIILDCKYLDLPENTNDPWSSMSTHPVSRFSFDCHDNAIFSSTSVNSLIEHYKDPDRCMFFEPLLTIPVHRRQPFSLQHLSRAAICTQVCNNDYDSLQRLPLPKSLVDYLRYYHYKRSVGVREMQYQGDICGGGGAGGVGQFSWDQMDEGAQN